MPEELCQPIPLSSNGLGVSRFVMRLGSSAAAVIEGALKGDVLGLLAWAEMEIEGVAPRLPVTVTFDPAELLNTLARIVRQPNALLCDSRPTRRILRARSSASCRCGSTDTLGGNFSARLRRKQWRISSGSATATLSRRNEHPVEFSISLRMRGGFRGQVSWDLSEPFGGSAGNHREPRSVRSGAAACQVRRRRFLRQANGGATVVERHQESARRGEPAIDPHRLAGFGSACERAAEHHRTVCRRSRRHSSSSRPRCRRRDSEDVRGGAVRIRLRHLGRHGAIRRGEAAREFPQKSRGRNTRSWRRRFSAEVCN